MSRSIATAGKAMITPVSHDEERRAYADFASRHGEAQYRAPLAELYATWLGFSNEYFAGRLLEPHLAFGRTAPRSLGHCQQTTGYGGRLQITFNDGLVIAPNRDWVINPWPAPGLQRFVEDLLLRFTVRQHVLEVEGAQEEGYRGYGPRFTKEANRIGLTLGLPRSSYAAAPGTTMMALPAMAGPTASARPASTATTLLRISSSWPPGAPSGLALRTGGTWDGSS